MPPLNDNAFSAGDRVLTPAGLATVVYRRYGTSLGKVEAYSVRLDLRAEDPRYTGTIYAAADVRPALEETP
jgi:hypothetical protein